MELLIIADDFTGALDAGVQVAQKGYCTTVLDHKRLKDADTFSDAEVVCVSTESRHLQPEEAYERVFQTVQRFGKKVPLFYKKTDSALRGNIGSELAAVMAAAGEQTACFVPAYPSNGRTTINGIQYINGLRAEESVFGQDPFEPVKSSYIPALFSAQTDLMPFLVVDDMETPHEQQKSVYIFDAATEQDLLAAVDKIHRWGSMRVFAGCAGFAEKISAFFTARPSVPEASRRNRTAPLLIVSGSQNPITIAQIAKAEEAGLPVHWLHTVKELRETFCDLPMAEGFVQTVCRDLQQQGTAIISVAQEKNIDILDSGTRERRRQQVCQAIGRLVGRVTARQQEYDIAVFGGDTIAGITEALFDGIVYPVQEFDAGIVLSIVKDDADRSHYLISKSGGFGSEDTVISLTAAWQRQVNHIWD